MFIAKISYKEEKNVHIQKIEYKNENVFCILRAISKLDDLDIQEIHIYREAK